MRDTVKPLAVVGVVCAVAAPAFAEQMVTTGWLSHDVAVHDAATGAPLPESVATGVGNLLNPHSVVIGADGLMYVTSTGTNSVKRYDRHGNFVDTFVTPGSGSLNSPTDAKFGPDGHLYVASYNNARILKYDSTSGAPLGRFDEAGQGLTGPEYLHFGNGVLFVVSGPGAEVRRYNDQTGAFVDSFVTQALNDPHAMTFGPDGNIYVSNFGNPRVVVYDPNSGARIGPFIRDDPGTPEDETAGLSQPHGLAFGPDGHLYVASFSTDEILRYDGATGAFIDKFITNATAGLDAPTFVGFFPDVCLGDVNGDQLVNITDLGAVLASFGAGSGALLPEGDVDGDGAVNITDLGLVLAAFGQSCN